MTIEYLGKTVIEDAATGALVIMSGGTTIVSKGATVASSSLTFALNDTIKGQAVFKVAR